jgi:hypothetical protein
MSRNPLFDFQQVRFNVMVNHFDRSTVFADIFVTGSRKISKSGTVALAKWYNPALSACSRKICFKGSELGSQHTVHNGTDATLRQVSELPFLKDEKIAWITVSVMFDNQIATACVMVAARCLDAVNKEQQDVFEESDRYIIEVFFEPLVKQLDVKFPGFPPAYGECFQ